MTIRSYQYQVQALVSPGSGGEVTASVAQSVVLSEVVVYSVNTVDLSVVDPLDLLESASALFLPGGQDNVVQSLGVSDFADSTLHPTVIQSLGLSDAAAGTVQDLLQSPRDVLSLESVATFGFKVRNLTVSQSLAVTDSVSRVSAPVATQSLNLTQHASFTDIKQSLTLTQVVTWGYGYDALDTVVLQQVLDVNQVLNKTMVDPLGVVQSVGWFVETRCGRYQFQQFHGAGGVAPKDKKLNYASTFTLRSLDTGEFLELRNPETDNRRRYAFNRVSRNFFDGTTDSYTDPQWATEDTQIYTIVALKRDKLEALHTFLSANLGREVLLRDWKGVTWTVIITNPGEVYTEDGEGRWTVDFEVEGVAIEGEFVLDRPQITGEVSRSGSIWVRAAQSGLSISERVNLTLTLEPSTTITVDETATFTIVAP